MRIAKSQGNTRTELSRIAWLSLKNPNQNFYSVMHHINVESLIGCFNTLDGKKAVGIDGVDKESYGKDLAINLEGLIKRMKQMAYHPGPVRQVLIPKEDKPNATRPLGISNFEDKLVQKRVQEILESIYDPIFLDCSYGFRPERGCHDAIENLIDHLFRNEVETVIDVDLANYFNTIDHELLSEMLRMKIKDTKFLRYIDRIFKAGTLANGELVVSEEGVVQGGCHSPVLANIFAHYVIDTWLEEIVKPRMAGTIRAFRYADDLIICCRYAKDGLRIKEVLGKRLAKFKLKLNEEKTKLVAFSKSKSRQGIKQGTFDFLGFTFYLGKSRRGFIVPKLKTSGKRLSSKLKKVNDWAKKVRNQHKLHTIWKTFCAKLRGHIQYYGVSHNGRSVREFLDKATRILFKWLNRRSQRRSFDWQKFRLFMKRFPLPSANIAHQMFEGDRLVNRVIVSPLP